MCFQFSQRDSRCRDPHPIGCVLIAFNTRREFLLVLRDDKPSIPFPNTWNLLGGFLEAGETPEACLRREIREEIGVELSELAFFRRYDWDDCIEYFFWQQLDLDLATIDLCEGQQLAYFCAATVARMPLAFRCNQVIADFLGERAPQARPNE